MSEVEKIFEESGYYKGRKIDISSILGMLNRYGYHYNNIQREFLENYTSLRFKYIHPIWKQEIIISLEPEKAQKEISMDVVQEYNKYLNDSLVIIGDIDKENMTLFLSEKGIFYSAFDDCIIEWGNDFKKMITMLQAGIKGNLHVLT